MNQIDFQAEYNRNRNLNFIKTSFLPEDFCESHEKIDHLGNVDFINSVTFLGNCRSLDLNVYEIEHCSEQDPRVTITKNIFRLMKHFVSRRSLVFLVSKNSSHYRLSLVTLDFSVEGKKLKQEFSNPRRYSFLLGPGTKTHTPEQFIAKKGRVKDFDDLKSRFSIEIVNKEFYEEIAWLFTELVGGTRGTGRQEETFKGSLILPSTSDHQTKQEFAVKLIGRLVFCWFLKKKCSENGLALLPEELLSIKAVEKNNQFYHQVLEPLFFEVLNTPIVSRDKKYACSPWSQIPFLNGGLFSPRNLDFYEPRRTGISNYLNTLRVPNDWLKELLGVFETYNFTIDENTSVDVELSIEPEMLGRIFENLLAEINPETGESARKATGSYYTPRPIVDFMVDECLKQYIINKTKISENSISKLLSYNDFEIIYDENEKNSIIEALDEIKIIDPACGSGAFPMGVLHKMLLILQKIDPDSNVWLDKQILKIENIDLRKRTKAKLSNENVNYIHKLGIIQNAIYGVDIQPIAVEMSKLRFFLSLIVDEKIDDIKENRGIEPLPNLEFKIVCANSLVELPKQTQIDKKKGIISNLFESTKDIVLLKKLRDEYLRSWGDEKIKIEKEFQSTQTRMFNQSINWNGFESQSFSLSQWNPFCEEPCSWFDSDWMFGIKNGFDIVIGNPPWGLKYEPKLRNKYKISYKANDSAAIFLENSSKLTNSIYSMIIKNSIVYIDTWTEIRKHICSNGLFSVMNAGLSFESANIESIVVCVNKKRKISEYSIFSAEPLRKLVETKEIIYKTTCKIEHVLEFNTLIVSEMNSEVLDLLHKIVSNSNNFSKFMENSLRGQDLEHNQKGSIKYLRQGPQMSRYGINKYYLIVEPNNNNKMQIIKRKKLFAKTLRGDRLAFCVDSEGNILTGSNYSNVILKSVYSKEDWLFLFLGIFNSTLMSFYVNKAIYSDNTETARHLDKNYIGRFPIPFSAVNILFDKRIKKLINLVKKVIEIKNNNPINNTQSIEARIDEIVYNLYNLTEREIGVIEGKDNI